MLRFLIMRILAAVPILLVLSVVTFAIIHAPPGDYGDYIRAQLMNQGGASYDVAEAQAQAYRVEHGLDKPLPVQYVLMMERLFITRDLTSFVNRGQQRRPCEIGQL